MTDGTCAVRVAVISVLVTGLAVTGVTGSAAADPREMTARPTVILVHGADADSSSWHGVVLRLQQARYPVISFSNPLRGVASDAARLSDLVASVRGPVVLVGHSYGGMVISVAAAGVPKVKSLVFVDAQIPERGETAAQLTNRFPGSQFGSALVARPFRLPGGGTDNDLYVDQAQYRHLFTGTAVSAATALALAAEQRPVAESALNEPAVAVAWHDIPSWDVIGTKDLAIPPAAQRFMARRAKAHVTELPASHVSMLAFPARVAQVVQAAAR